MNVKKRIMEIVDEAYNNGEARLTEEMSYEERGDGLAQFLRNEVSDVTDCAETLEEAAADAYNAIQTAIDELRAVQNALDF